MRLHAITLVVDDYDTGIAFYVGTLGFTLTSDEKISDGKRWVLVTPPGGGSSLLLAKAATENQCAAVGNQTGGRVGYFLETSDFEADFQKMKDAGIYFEEDPRHEPYGTVAVWHDPFGNRWDLLQLKK